MTRWLHGWPRPALACFLTTFIVACGGGGGSPAGSNGGAATVATTALTEGDSLTYQLSTTDLSASNTKSSFFTRGYNGFQVDGSYQQTTTFSDGTLRQVRSMNADGQWTGTVSFTSDRPCRNSVPVNSVGSALAVGQQWSQTYTQTCGAVVGNVVTLTGRVEAIEPVTTPAGSFSAYRVVLTEVGSPATGGSATGSYEKKTICWREVHLLQDVACDEVLTRTDASGTVSSVRNLTKLVGMSVARFEASVPTVARFAGSWSMDIALDSSFDVCSVFASESGVLTGHCMGAWRDLVGSVDAQGHWQISQPNYSDVFNGTANAVRVSGTRISTNAQSNGRAWSGWHD